uniref:Uncharacterized protein n=1 Tax=Oryza brachyantha TaxID=4533 RepID=J3L6Y4_ORYBR
PAFSFCLACESMQWTTSEMQLTISQNVRPHISLISTSNNKQNCGIPLLPS